MDDLLHAVAYGGTGLGMRSVPTPERVEELQKEEGRERVEEWKNEWWLSEKAAERMVLVAVGGELDHQHFNEEAEKALGWVGKSADGKKEGINRRESNKGLLSRLVASLGLSKKDSKPSYEEVLGRPSEYVGGKVCLDEGGDQEWLEGGTQVVLGFEGLREGDEDEVSLARFSRFFFLFLADHLTILWSPDGSRSHRYATGRSEKLPAWFVALFPPSVRDTRWTRFSDEIFRFAFAGGPGTGMRSRLFLNILAKDPSVLSAQAFNLSYSDSGSSLSSLSSLPCPFTSFSRSKLTPNPPSIFLLAF